MTGRQIDAPCKSTEIQCRPQQLLGLAAALLGAYFIWWLLNMAFPDKMHTLIAAVRAAL